MENIDLLSYLTPKMREILERAFPGRPDGELQEQIEECLKFLYIASLGGRTFIPLSSELDDIWHELIVETRFYQDFCSSLPGGQFMHHTSIDMQAYAREIGKDRAVEEALDWLPRYYLYFGEFTDRRARWWSVVQFLRNEMSLSLKDINDVARDAATVMVRADIAASSS